jgi:hypothetical protein
MTDKWRDAVPVLDSIAQVADPARYVPLPDDWLIGVSDVVDSTKAIADGRYKSVNLAGASTISAVANALGGKLALFVFGGDGARFAVSPAQAQSAADALSRVAMWAKRDLELELRVAMTSVAEARAAGFDCRVAFWHASDDVRYAAFTGGGLEWAEAQMKSGAIGLAPAAAELEPDLTGLSCQWGAVRPKRGRIVSLIIKMAPGASEARFAEILSTVPAVLGELTSLNPLPVAGPDLGRPASAIALQARIAHKGRPGWWRRCRVTVTTALIWLVFKLGIPIGRFDPARYRREISLNADFRKFDDGLMMTVDCSADEAARLGAKLQDAAREGVIRYGMHMQDEALITCIVPSVMAADHMHFIDGAGGGYAAAARQLRDCTQRISEEEKEVVRAN